MTPTRNNTTRGTKFEGFVLVVILLAVGGAAGAASFTHVHDWTMHNSPATTGHWFGWANAVITELVPVAALLVMRRRRAAGQPILYPASLLVGAMVLSVTAQLAVAKPGFSGGLVSVIPALAFAALAKLILGKAPAAEVAEETAPAPVRDERPRPVPAVPVPVASVPSVPAVPAPAVPVLAAEDRPEPVPAVPAEIIRAVASVPVSAPPAQVITNVPALGGPVSDWPAPPLPADLLHRARTAATEHEQTNGRPITRDELRAVLRVSNDTTGQIMRALGLNAARAVLNGTER